MMTNSDRYAVKVVWSEDDEAFLATVPDLPGCSAVGDTREEALAEVADAIDAWIEATQAAGNRVPMPTVARSEDTFSGKVLIRMPRSLHALLAQQADDEGVSLNQHMVAQLTQGATVGCIRSFIDAAKVVMVSTRPSFLQTEILPHASRVTSTGNTSRWSTLGA